MRQKILRKWSQQRRAATTIKRRAFTLLEIFIAVALIGMLASLVSWHFMKMVSLYHFQKHVALFVTKLQELQLVALAREADFKINVFPKAGQLVYQVTSDEPLPFPCKEREMELKGAAAVSAGGVFQETLCLTISPKGVVEPAQKIGFYFKSAENEEEAIWVDLSRSLQISFSKK